MRNFHLRLPVRCLALALGVALLGAVGPAKAQEPAASDSIVLLLNKAKIFSSPPAPSRLSSATPRLRTSRCCGVRSR